MKRILPPQQILFLVLSLGIVLSGCHKYEEGPGLSLRSREGRVANAWKVPFLSRNSIDVTAKYDHIWYDFTKAGRFVWTQKLAGETEEVLEGSWLLVDADTHLRMVFDDKAKAGQEMLQADILELRENQMKIAYVLQGNEYTARLIPR